ncbi:hypothetical protein [Stenotrophomonas sp. AN71]|uniref:hypothetical protein n=1 Tax=Stenotrophomonas sp. AN71 TaxID=3156253 RepID=UPI003D236C1D
MGTRKVDRQDREGGHVVRVAGSSGLRCMQGVRSNAGAAWGCWYALDDFHSWECRMRIRFLNQRRRGRARVRRMRSCITQVPILVVAPMDASTPEDSKVRAEALMNLHLARLVQQFPSLGTQLRLALYLDRESLLLAMAAVLSWHQLSSSRSLVREQELRDLHVLLAHLGALLVDRPAAGTIDPDDGQMHQTSF